MTRKFREFKKFKLDSLLSFKLQWVNTLLRLIQLGKDKKIKFLERLQSKIQEVPISERVAIFQTVFLCESIKSMKQNLSNKLRHNKSYRVNYVVLDQILVNKPYFQDYVYGVQASKRDPLGHLLGTGKEMSLESARSMASSAKTEKKRKDLGGLVDEVQELMEQQKHGVVLETLWDCALGVWKRNRIVFELSEKFMIGLLLSVYGHRNLLR